MKSEIKKLEDWLVKNHIQHTSGESFIGDGKRILVSYNREKLSFVCHGGSYGHERGLIEMWDFKDEHEVEGWLTAEQCKRRIKRLLGLDRKK